MAKKATKKATSACDGMIGEMADDVLKHMYEGEQAHVLAMATTMAKHGIDPDNKDEINDTLVKITNCLGEKNAELEKMVENSEKAVRMLRGS